MKITCLFCNNHAKCYSEALHWCRECDVQYNIVDLPNGKQCVHGFNITVEPKYTVHYNLYKNKCFINFYDKNNYFVSIKDIPIDKMLVQKSELEEKINTIITYL